MLKQNSKLSKKEARDILESIIQAQLAALQKEVSAERRRQRKRVVGGFGAVTAAVAIGVFGGFPAAVAGALTGAAAIAGGRLLGKAAEAACEHGANLRQQNELYFLLRLIKQAERE